MAGEPFAHFRVDTGWRRRYTMFQALLKIQKVTIFLEVVSDKATDIVAECEILTFDEYSSLELGQ